jgi:ketosteroid isomerase-like protein
MVLVKVSHQWDNRQMGGRSLDIVQRTLDAAERRDWETLAELLHPDVRWHGAGDDEGGCHDRGEALAFMRRAFDEGAEVRVERLVEAGELVVAAMGRARPGADGVDYETGPHGMLVRVRDGRIVELTVYPSPDEAVEAASALR